MRAGAEPALFMLGAKMAVDERRAEAGEAGGGVDDGGREAGAGRAGADGGRAASVDGSARAARGEGGREALEFFVTCLPGAEALLAEGFALLA